MSQPRPVPVHVPLAAEEVMELCRAHLLHRAGEVLGLPGGPLKDLTRGLIAADALALTTATARLLAAKIAVLEPVCPSCAGTDRVLLCAEELGTLDGRLTAAADRAVYRLAQVMAQRTGRPASAPGVGFSPAVASAAADGPQRVSVTRHTLCRERRRPGAAVLEGLLRHRADLAASAAEHTAHDLPGADLLWLGLDSVDKRIRELSPDTWQRSYRDWTLANGAGLHTAETPQPASCRICAAAARNNLALLACSGIERRVSCVFAPRLRAIGPLACPTRP